MIFVIGAGRTGTSTVARVLQERMGVDMGGPGRLSDAVPEGDYEDPHFAMAARALWRGEIDTKEWRETALMLAKQKEEPWGIKYPVHSEFMPSVMNTFPEGLWIWCQRDIHDTWQSWLRVFQLDPDEAWARINYRNWAIQLAMLKTPHLEIDFTKRLPEEQIEEALGEGIELLAPGYLNGNLRQTD